MAYEQDPKGKVLPQFAVDEIYRITKGDAIITTEVGQHQMWAAQFYKFNKPRRWITSGGLGTMGFGFPAAIGASFAFPDATVIDIAGDGSFQMTLQELAIVKEHDLNVKVVVLNNKFLGMVKQWQDLFFDKRYASTSIPAQPDFVKLADAYGIKGYRAETPEGHDAGSGGGLQNQGALPSWKSWWMRKNMFIPWCPPAAPTRTWSCPRKRTGRGRSGDEAEAQGRQKMRHTISVMVKNQAGVLSRVSNLFSARGYNIDSLVVGVTDDPKISRITIVVRGDDRIIDQVEKQLNKLIDVIKVIDLTHDDFIARDLALIKVKAEPNTRSQVMEIVQCFDGKIVDVALKSFIIEVTGKESKINAMVELLKQLWHLGNGPDRRSGHFPGQKGP